MEALEVKLLSLPPLIHLCLKPKREEIISDLKDLPAGKHINSTDFPLDFQKHYWGRPKEEFSDQGKIPGLMFVKGELPPTSGDLTWTFSLQELRPFPTAFGGGDGMLLWTDSPGCNRPLPGIKATSVLPSCLQQTTNTQQLINKTKGTKSSHACGSVSRIASPKPE